MPHDVAGLRADHRGQDHRTFRARHAFAVRNLDAALRTFGGFLRAIDEIADVRQDSDQSRIVDAERLLLRGIGNGDRCERVCVRVMVIRTECRCRNCRTTVRR